MNHLDEGTIQAFLDDQLSGRERAATAEHIMACAACRSVHDELRRAQGIVASAIPLLDSHQAPAITAPERRRPPLGLPVAFIRAAGLVLFLAAAAAAAVPGSPVRDWMIQVLDREPEPESMADNAGPADALSGAPGEAAVLVRGTVRDGSGRPLAFARVSVVDDTASAWTDEAGEYQLFGVPDRQWRVRAAHPGHEQEERVVRLPDDGALSVDFSLRPIPGPTRDPLGDFEPFDVSYTLPSLLNTDEVTAAIEHAYPVPLVNRGVGGEAVLLIWVDERGRVARSVVSASSGHRELDRIALAVSRDMRFRPARSGNSAVRVIVQIPVVFAPDRDDDDS